jgi:thiamine transport system permease protein
MKTSRASVLPVSLGAPGLLVTSIFLLVGLVIPLAAVLIEAVSSNIPIFDPVILAITRATVEQALMSTAISCALGLPLGLWVGALSHGWIRAARALLIFPFAVPTVAAAISWVSWLGQGGLGWAYSFEAVVLAHVFFNVPLVALNVSQARAGVSVDEINSAKLLGAGNFSALRYVTWPRIRLQFVSAGAQVFSLCAMSFAIVLILGGGPPVETLETALYSRIRFSTLDVEGAVACALWQIVIVGLAWVVASRFAGSERKLPRGSLRRTKVIAPAAALFFCAIWVIPYGVVLTKIVRLFADVSLLWSVLEAGRVSFLISAASAAIATVMAFLASLSAVTSSWPRRLVFLYGLPSGVSIVVLGLGLWLAYASFVDPFEGSPAMIVLIQATIFFPIAFRILFPAVREVRAVQWEAAVSLGATSLRAYRWVEFPRLKGPLAAVFALGFSAGMGELAAVSLFYSESLIPLPLLISRLNSQYRFEDAEAVAGALMLLSISAISAVIYWGGDHAHDRAAR